MIETTKELELNSLVEVEFFGKVENGRRKRNLIKQIVIGRVKNIRSLYLFDLLTDNGNKLLVDLREDFVKGLEL